MSLQVAPRVAVRLVPTSVDWGTPAEEPIPLAESAREPDALSLTSRDIMDEARRRLASKDYHWD